MNFAKFKRSQTNNPTLFYIRLLVLTYNTVTSYKPQVFHLLAKAVLKSQCRWHEKETTENKEKGRCVAAAIIIR